MRFYHGTTYKITKQILQKGFSPKPPSNAVWFTTNKEYTIGHAKGKAGARHDRPVVLECELDIKDIDAELSRKCILGEQALIAVKKTLSPDVVVYYELLDLPTSPEDLNKQLRLAQLPSSPENMSLWLNQIFGLKSNNRLSPRNPGIQKLCQWIAKNKKSGVSRTTIKKILDKAKKCLPQELSKISVKYDSRRFYPKHINLI